jgi:hypothetical protein
VFRAAAHYADELLDQIGGPGRRPDQGDSGVVGIGHRAVDDVAPVVQAGDRMRHDGDADSGGDQFDGGSGGVDIGGVL